MMNEQIHAYVDRQLDALSRRRFERRMAEDPKLAEEVAEIQALKRMVQQAYGVAPAGEMKPARPRRAFGRWAGMAAMLLVGVVTGLLAGYWLQPQDQAPASVQLAAGDHVILHIDRDAPDALNRLLARAEQLAEKDVKVTLVANAEAVKLFSVQYSPSPARIEHFLDTHENVQLVVCRRALRNMARLGIRLKPLPEARTDTFALDFIVQGVERGWKYQKI